uniref:Mitofilin n=1 Tax=Steinernema glaseri TaxID=37863 RepID=A0A1I7ZYR4_9BILA
MTLLRRIGSKIGEFCRNVANDYATVARETVTGSKERPFRAALALSGLGGLGYAFFTNPTEEDLHNTMAEKRQQMVLVPNAIHNPVTNEELRRRTILLNQNRLDYYNCFFFSLLVEKEHDTKTRLYATQDSNLKKWIWQEVFDNIVDVGAFGTFYNLERSFIDFDINVTEFPAEEKTS